MASRIKEESGSRTSRYRRRQALRGTKRVEVSVPAQDIELIRELATELRAAGEEADRLRERVRAALGFRPARTGDELIEFFRQSPLVGEDLSFDRDRSPGRPITL